VRIFAGTTAADSSLVVTNAASTLNYLNVLGDGGVSLNGVADEGLGTLNATGLYVNGAPVSTAASAGPTATVGLSPVNGSASTFMRSDAAPALSQSISPVMTGNWTFAPSTGIGMVIDGSATNNIAQFVSGTNGTTGVADLIVDRHGSTANNVGEGPSLQFQDTANSTASIIQQSGGQTEFWQNNGSWVQTMHTGTSDGLVVGSPTGGDKGVGTVNMGGCYINGVACTSGVSHIAYSGISSTCAISSPSSNVTACSHTTGSGIYNVTISGFSSIPMCVASTGLAFVQYAQAGSSSTNAQFATYNISGSNADEGFNLICVL
jgi:hypothetical protein